MQAIEHVGRLEISTRTSDVNEAASVERTFLEEDERNAPIVLHDHLVAMPTTCACASRALDAVDARQATQRNPPFRVSAQPVGIGDWLIGCRECFEKRCRAFVRGTLQVKPQRPLTAAERIRQLFAEAQYIAVDERVAAPTFRPIRRCGFDQNSHMRPASDVGSRYAHLPGWQRVT